MEKEVHWHGLRSFQAVIRRVPDRAESTTFFPLPRRCEHDARRTTELPPPLSPLKTRSIGLPAYSSPPSFTLFPVYRRGRSKEPWPLPLRACMCVIIESHRNRISHGNRDGRYRRWILYFDCLLTSVFFSGIIKWKKKKRKRKGIEGRVLSVDRKFGIKLGLTDDDILCCNRYSIRLLGCIYLTIDAKLRSLVRHVRI